MEQGLMLSIGIWLGCEKWAFIPEWKSAEKNSVLRGSAYYILMKDYKAIMHVLIKTKL